MASQAHVEVLRGISILQAIVGVLLQVAYLRRDYLLCTIPKSARFFLPYAFQVYQGSFGPKHLTPFTNNNLYNRNQVVHGLSNNGKEGERQVHFSTLYAMFKELLPLAYSLSSTHTRQPLIYSGNSAFKEKRGDIIQQNHQSLQQIFQSFLSQPIMKDSLDVHILAHTHLQATLDKHIGAYQ